MEARLADPVRTLTTGDALTIRPLTTLRGASMVLADNWLGALPVRGSGGVEGIVTERDLVRAVADGVDVNEERVRSVMSDDPAAVDAELPIRAAGELMLREQIRHLVVTEDDRIVGVVSIRDVLGVALHELAVTLLD